MKKRTKIILAIGISLLLVAVIASIIIVLNRSFITTWHFWGEYDNISIEMEQINEFADANGLIMITLSPYDSWPTMKSLYCYEYRDADGVHYTIEVFEFDNVEDCKEYYLYNALLTGMTNDTYGMYVRIGNKIIDGPGKISMKLARALNLDVPEARIIPKDRKIIKLKESIPPDMILEAFKSKNYIIYDALPTTEELPAKVIYYIVTPDGSRGFVFFDLKTDLPLDNETYLDYVIYGFGGIDEQKRVRGRQIYHTDEYAVFVYGRDWSSMLDEVIEK